MLSTVLQEASKVIYIYLTKPSTAANNDPYKTLLFSLETRTLSRVKWYIFFCASHNIPYICNTMIILL